MQMSGSWRMLCLRAWCTRDNMSSQLRRGTPSFPSPPPPGGLSPELGVFWTSAGDTDPWLFCSLSSSTCPMFWGDTGGFILKRRATFLLWEGKDKTDTGTQGGGHGRSHGTRACFEATLRWRGKDTKWLSDQPLPFPPTIHAVYLDHWSHCSASPRPKCVP